MMTLQSRAASAYASVNLESRAGASGGVDLVMLLIEGVIDRVKLARKAIESRDIQQKIIHMNKALQIIGEGLRAHLDVQAGGEIAQNLDDLYAYCSVRLLHANSRNDVQALDEVVKLLTPILEAWTVVRNGGQAGSELGGQKLAEVTRTLKSAMPAMQRAYGSSAYAGLAAGV